MSWPRLHALAVMKMFYAGPDHCGSGRLVNPVPEWSAEPRDHLFDALVAAMRSDRNRALLGFYVSTGAMASELLGVTVDQVDPGEQRIGVHRKVRDGCNGDGLGGVWWAVAESIMPTLMMRPNSPASALARQYLRRI